MSKDEKEEKDIEFSNSVELTDEEQHGGKSTVGQAAFNMAKTIVGAGVFGLPTVYQKTGFVTVTVLIVGLVFLVYWTLLVLLRAGLKANTWSYHDLMRKCFGPVGSYTYAIFAFLFAFGGMCAYVVIVGDTLPIVLRSLVGMADTNAKLTGATKYLTDRRVVIIITSLFVMLPVSSFRDISKLAKFSVSALIAIIMISGSVIIAGVSLTQEQRIAGATPPGNPNKLTYNPNFFTVFNSEGISGAVGTLCFAYVCHHNTFIIFRSLKKPSLNGFSKVNIFSLGYAMLVFLVVGISGFALFNGLFSGSNVLNVFSNTNGLINFARALFAYEVLLTYPLALFVCRDILLKVFFDLLHVVLYNCMWFYITIVSQSKHYCVKCE